MRMVDLINKKKKGETLTESEIQYIVKNYTNGQIPDYQMSAFLMAVCFKGMTKEETAQLTMAYVESGETVDLSEITGIKVDKHSSGGVGDKISLVVIGMCAAAGIPVAKMSGRGLGHTGGTIDKLESIPGFKTELSRDEFIEHVNKYKMAIVGQSPHLTPADKKIYALRDVTSTVDSIPLIAASIMSKKIAAGADCIVLDVKVGSGAFMKSIEEAKALARTMVDIGNALGRKTVALITDMNQPLGHEVGNANEIREVIEILKGNGAEDEKAVAFTVASHMCVLGGVYPDFDTAYKALEDIVASGKALEKFKELVRIQGGDVSVIEEPSLLPNAKYHIEVKAEEAGFVSAIDAEAIGVSAMLLGAGRQTKDDVIDFGAGITMVNKIGDVVNVGDTLCVLHTNMEDSIQAQKVAKEAFTISKEKPQVNPYIYDVIK